MLTRKAFTFLLMLLLAIGLLTACSDENSAPTLTSATGTDEYTTMDFSLPYGGLTTSDEAEAFDDYDLKMELLEEDGQLADDPMENDPEVRNLENQGANGSHPGTPNRPRFTYLHLRWGMIDGPADTLAPELGDCGILDWTGQIRTDRGIVVVKRLIKFERPGDHLVRPRIDRQTVAFVSHTGCHFDGLVLQVIERPQDINDETLEPNKLYIETGPFSGEYLVSELTETNDVIDVDAVGNQIQITGFTISDIADCPKGFLSGRYRILPTDIEKTADLTDDSAAQVVGTYKGKWITLNGGISGFLRGAYGYNEDGDRVFFGKYITRRGAFRGLIRGTWEPAENTDEMATFTGQWINAAGSVNGLLGGTAHSVPDCPGGFFEGRWTTLCDDEAEGSI